MGKHADEPSVKQHALTLLIERHQSALHSFLYTFTGNAEQSRDLVQDTFCAAWNAMQRNMAPFNDVVAPEDNVRGWLFRVAYRKAVSQWRRQRLIQWTPLDDVLAKQLMVGETGLSFDERVAEQELLRLALSRLDPQEVACLLLRIVQGFSTAEVSQIVDASIDAVTKRLSRAKQRLRAAYLAQSHHEERTRS